MRQGLTFEEMESRTKVRAKYLRLLEEDRFAEVSAHTYVKGFLKTYADELGLDGQLYVDEYNSRYVAGEEEAPLRTRKVPAARARSRDRREHRVVVVALAAIAILTALVIAAWRVGGPEEQMINGLGGNQTTTQASKVLVEVRAADGATYMEGYAGGAGGKLLYAGTLEKGQTHRFPRKRVVFLSVAAPGNVGVKVNGNRVAMPDGGDWLIGPRGVSVP